MPQILSCKIMPVWEGEVSGNSNKTFSVPYQIETDSEKFPLPHLIEQSVSASPNPVPKQYDFYEHYGVVDLSAYCLSVKYTQNRTNHKFWDVTVNYGQLGGSTPPRSPDQAVENPLLRPVKYWLETITEVVPVETDRFGKPLRNAAGQEFVDPITEERHIQVLAAQRNVATLQEIIDLQQTYDRAVNVEEYRSGAPWTWKVLPIESGQVIYENGYVYYSPTIRLAYKVETWKRRILNQGFQHFDNATDKNLIRATDANGDPVSEPVLLKTDGTRLTTGNGNFQTSETLFPKKFDDLGV